MISLDTNMLVRLYVDEGDRQSARQRELVVRLIRESEELFVPKTVLLELEWVLRGYYKFGRDPISQAMSHLLGLDNVSVEDESSILEALRHYEAGLDFADALHAASSARSTQMLTFDRRFFNRARRIGVKPPVSIPG